MGSLHEEEPDERIADIYPIPIQLSSGYSVAEVVAPSFQNTSDSRYLPVQNDVNDINGNENRGNDILDLQENNINSAVISESSASLVDASRELQQNINNENDLAHIPALPNEYNGEDSNDSTIPEMSTLRPSSRDDEEPPSKCAKIEIPNAVCYEDDDADGQTCSICLDVWTVSGEHRIAALKCGHLFGHSCIERWLKQMPKNMRSCPTCKSKASGKDIRFIYAKKIAMVDNSEIERLKEQLEVTTTEKNRLEMELYKSVLNQQMICSKVTKLEREIMQLKQACIEVPSQPKFWKYALRSNFEITKDGSCRVVAFNSRNKELYVSQMSTNSLFPGYAMRKISCFQWKLGKLLHLHPKIIRDAAFSDENDILITVGLDKMVKLVQGANESVMSTLMAEMPLWSCCWDESNNNRFYVGGVGGVVSEYDIRQPKACISRIPPQNDMSPVASLVSVPNGFLAVHLNSFRAHCKSGSTYVSKQLSIDGSLLSVRRNPVTDDVLVSCRPSANYNQSRHMVCAVDLNDDFGFVIKRSFSASHVQSLMARSAIYSIGDDEFVAAHSESDKAVCIWSVNSGKLVQQLGASDNVVDILPITNDCKDLSHLVTLSASRVRIYEAVVSEA